MSETIRTPLFNRYEVLGELGEGGWGTVYKARHKVMGRMVALKVLPPSIRKDSEAQERFKREAMALARFDHPHIARIYDADIEQNIPYLAMELIEGRDLAKVLFDKRRLSFESTIRLGLEIAEALDHIHQAGIVHRDIKPSNIIIRPDGQAVLTDFGIAFASSLPRITREVNGTPEFMSPEQVDGSTVDGLSDIYSLGVVLYKCLAGMVPFKGDGESLTALNALLQQILHEDATPLNMRRFETPLWLSKVVHRCLEKKPADRYPSGQALINALRAGALPQTGEETVLQPIVLAFSDPFVAEHPNDTPEPDPDADQPDAPPEPAVAADLPEETPEPVAEITQPKEEPEPEEEPEPDALHSADPESGVAGQPHEIAQPVSATKTDTTHEADREATPVPPRPPSKKLRWAGVVIGGALLLGSVAYAAGLFTPDDDPHNALLTNAGDTSLTDNGTLSPPDTASFQHTDENILPAPDTSATALTDTLSETQPNDSIPAVEIPKPVDTFDPKPVDLPAPKPPRLEDMTEAALLNAGSNAYSKKEYDEALRFLKEAARRGSAEGHYLLGWMYDHAQGVPRNPGQATTHYQTAAERGHPEAQYTLGAAYLNANSGLKQDKEAILLLEQAAAQGHRDAQASLGLLYEQGQRVRRSSKKAATWYKEAAQRGNRTAQYKLAEMYRDGRGVESNNEEAFRWYLAAANQNDANAQYWVGRFYWQGRGGVRQDKAEARVWYTRAAAQGQEEAQRALADNPGK